MSKIRIRTRCGKYAAELDGSAVSDAIWLALPQAPYANMLGCQIFFELPVDVDAQGGQTVFEKGDVAYWPGPKALCIFFGPTPLSGDDGRPVSRYPLLKIGRVCGDCDSLEGTGDRQRIFLERAF